MVIIYRNHEIKGQTNVKVRTKYHNLNKDRGWSRGSFKNNGFI